MHGMHLSLATREDAQALADLLAMNGLMAPEPMNEAAAQARWDATQQALPGVRVIVGRRCDGTVMGALTLAVLPSATSGDAPSAVIEDLAVHPVMHREGLGRQLVECAKEVAQHDGCRSLVLSASRGVAGAQGFFDRLGFESMGGGLGVAVPGAQMLG